MRCVLVLLVCGGLGCSFNQRMAAGASLGVAWGAYTGHLYNVEDRHDPACIEAGECGVGEPATIIGMAAFGAVLGLFPGFLLDWVVEG